MPKANKKPIPILAPTATINFIPTKPVAPEQSTGKNPSCLIEIDGGVSLKNYKKLIELGADALVAGNAVFGAEDPFQAIKEFKRKF